MATLRGVTSGSRAASRVYARPADSLDDDLLARWKELLARPDVLSSPFYHPAYVRTVADVLGGVEVGIVERAGEPVGFVPFERSRLDVGGAVGRRLCDLAGPIAEPGLSWDPEALSRAAGLRLLRLRHVPASVDRSSGSVDRLVEAPFIDLSGGYEAWREASLDSGSRFVKQIERRARKLERQVGPIRLVWHTTDRHVFETLLEWKAAQRAATNSPNVLLLPWARELVERLRTVETDDFAGVVSAVYAGDRLCAAHFGLRTRRVLHYWVPAYNVDLSSYSPGLLALTEIMQAAEKLGIERIDFGPGEERFKLRSCTGSMRLATVTATTAGATRAAVGAADRLRSWSRESPLGDALRSASRALTRGAFAVRAAMRRE